MIRLKLSEHYCIILFISPSVNNFQVEEKVVNPRRTDSFELVESFEIIQTFELVGSFEAIVAFELV